MTQFLPFYYMKFVAHVYRRIHLPSHLLMSPNIFTVVHFARYGNHFAPYSLIYAPARKCTWLLTMLA
jgi:hypothetical protein